MGTGTWSHQLERAERYLARFRRFATDGVPSPLVQDAADDVYSFFVHCLHVADYLERDPAFKGKAFKERDTHPDLQICRDIGIGIKHVERTWNLKPGEVPAVVGSQLVKIMTGDGGNPPLPTSTFEMKIEHDGQTRDALQIAQAAVAAWRKFVQQQSAAA